MRLPARVAQGYGVGATSIALLNTTVLFFLAKFLVDECGLEPVVAGFVVFVGKLWDALSDPIVGRLCDRTQTSFGSRRPWILFGMVPLALLFAAVWQRWPVEGTAAAVTYALLLMAYNTAYTAVVVPYGALTPGLTNDYDERTRLNSARMAWSMVGGIAAAILVPMLKQRTGTYNTGAMILAAASLVPFMITVYATHGRDQVVADPSQESMGSVLASRPFRRVATLFLAAWSSIAVLGALLPFYVEHRLQRPDMEDALFASVQFSALLCIPLVAWMAGRFEKHIAYAVLVGSWGLVLIGLAMVPPKAVWMAILIAIAAGPGVAAAHVLPWAMLPDVVELDRVKTGNNRPGAFYGMMTFLEKAATAVALQGILLMLSVAGYTAGAASQEPAAVLMIAVLIGPVPAVVVFAAALYAWRSPPLTRSMHRAALDQL